MTDAERDQIDSDAQNIIKTCRETIGHFRQEAERQKVHPQVKEHRAVVIFLIDAYLKGEEFFFFFLCLLLWLLLLLFLNKYLLF
jgi:hypothetical protein